VLVVKNKKARKELVPEGETGQLRFPSVFLHFSTFLNISAVCRVALFTPLALSALFCDLDVTPDFSSRARAN